jgi:O-antigen ligase
LLSFSSTALLVLVLSLLVGFILRGNAPLRLFLVAVAMVLLAVGAAFVPLERAKLFAVGDAVETFQAVLFGGEHSYNVDTRVETFDKALSTFAATPYVAFTGVGLGEFSAKAMRTDDPLVESFMLDALLNAGVIGFLALALSFLLLARYVSVVRRNAEGPSKIIAESLVRLAPGLVIANTLSGNSVQSEFVGGLLFVMLAACAWRASWPRSASAEGRT